MTTTFCSVSVGRSYRVIFRFLFSLHTLNAVHLCVSEILTSYFSCCPLRWRPAEREALSFNLSKYHSLGLFFFFLSVESLVHMTNRRRQRRLGSEDEIKIQDAVFFTRHTPEDIALHDVIAGTGRKLLNRRSKRDKQRGGWHKCQSFFLSFF